MIKRDEPSEDKTIELGHKLYQGIAKKVRAETLAEVEKMLEKRIRKDVYFGYNWSLNRETTEILSAIRKLKEE